MSKFAPSGSNAASTTVSEGPSTVANPVIANIIAALAATEYSYMIPVGAKRFFFKTRMATTSIQFAYIPGDSGTNFLTVDRGVLYAMGELAASASVTIYFQLSQPDILEIESWL